ncbi:MAG: hypothetical protein HFH34_04010 [Eubacterium sp.]|nr:hypothetical protein [Eubacterium sp.]
MKRKLNSTIAIFFLIIFIFSSIPVNAASKRIILNATTEYTLLIGEKVHLYIKGYKNSKEIIWKTSNKKIATVSKNGIVTAKKGGTAKISATINSDTYYANIFVLTGENIVYENDINPQDAVDRYEMSNSDLYEDDEIELNKTSINMSTSDTAKLKILNTTEKASWSSSNENVAKVDKNGKVTPVWFGTAIIKAKVGSKTLKCKVKVFEEDYWYSDNSDFTITIMPISSKKARVRILVNNKDQTISSGDLTGKYDDEGRIFVINQGKYNISAGISIVEKDNELLCVFVVTDASEDIFLTDGTILDVKEENS